MNKLILPIAVVVIIIAAIGLLFIFQISDFLQPQSTCGDGICDAKEKTNLSLCPKDCQTVREIPYYFITISNEPYNFAGGRQRIEERYSLLRQMIEKANQYNIKLTLTFPAQWADYISESPERHADLELWKAQGHEIAAHHHSIYYENWDGYTDYSKEEAEDKRVKLGKTPGEYIGTLKDFINKLNKINPNIKSGCVNDEYDKKEMTKEIIYETCSGFINYGEPGRRENASNPEKGRNEYITVGEYKDFQRKWVISYQIINEERQKPAEAVFNSTGSRIYGVDFHSTPNGAELYYAFLEFLHEKDTIGKKSRTVSEIIGQRVIPEKTISEEAINNSKPPSRQ